MLVPLLRWETQAPMGSDLSALVSASILCPHSSTLFLRLPNILTPCWFCCSHLGPFWCSATEEISAQSLNGCGSPRETHTAGPHAGTVCIRHPGVENTGYGQGQCCQSMKAGDGNHATESFLQGAHYAHFHQEQTPLFPRSAHIHFS